MNKTFLFSVIVACSGLSSIAPRAATGQVPVQNSTALEVIARNGADKEVHLTSSDGVVPMVLVRPNQTVPVTLQFPAARAGTSLAVTPLDGGRVNGNLTVLPTGKMLFTFSPGPVPGRYRVTVHIPPEQYLLEFYVVDPANPPQKHLRTR